MQLGGKVNIILFYTWVKISVKVIFSSFVNATLFVVYIMYKVQKCAANGFHAITNFKHMVAAE